jgi:dihydroxyacetone kinase-like protein
MNTQTILDAVQSANDAILANESVIESLDREIGDGDHFINIKRGCTVLMSMRDELAPLEPAEVLQRMGMKLMSTIGGASGPLIASFFIAMGKTFKGNDNPDGAEFAEAFSNGVDSIEMPLGEIVEKVKAEAERTMLGTKDTIAMKGRAHYLGERALGHIDPGSKTCQVAIWAICDQLTSNANL